MDSKGIVFILDAGNTAIKVGLFRHEKIEAVKRFNKTDVTGIKSFLETEPSATLVLSSVLSRDNTDFMVNELNIDFVIDRSSGLPIELDYRTPETLGFDRICNAIAIDKLSNTRFAVAIDFGTCIKFDLVEKNKAYLGGSIAPGLGLRYKSLNDYTDNLPLLSNKTAEDFVGKSTEESIRAGVIKGIKAEVNGLIREYEDCYPDLTFFVTGGDHTNFDLQAKNNIFANENLTLIGIYTIYTHDR
jgi:type III pantothenate kinase